MSDYNVEDDDNIAVLKWGFIVLFGGFLSFVFHGMLSQKNILYWELFVNFDRHYEIIGAYVFSFIAIIAISFATFNKIVFAIVSAPFKGGLQLVKLFFGIVKPIEGEAYSSGNGSALRKFEERIILLESQSGAVGNSDIIKKHQDHLYRDIKDSLESRFSADIEQNLPIARMERRFDHLISSLDNERSGTTLRSGMNLIIGIAIAIFGITILYGLLGEKLVDDEVSFLLAASRISVAIIIEIFAYFFLNLYRIGLQDIRYFRNEITNVMSQRLALETAIDQSNEDLVSRVIARLADTERNFVLKKGETTIGLSQNNSDREQDNTMLKTLSDTFTAGVKSANGKD